MKRIYTLLSFLLVVVMAAQLPVMENKTADAAKALKLSKKTVSIAVGDTVKIKVKNAKKSTKIKWKASKSSVAKIIKKNAKGRKAYATVKGVAKGTAKLTATYKSGKKNKKLICKVNVRAEEAPVGTPDAATQAPNQVQTTPPVQTETPKQSETPPVQTETPKQSETPSVQTEEPIVEDVKPRVINITDLIADPDDEQSLVRMFVTSNMVDIEGIIVSTSCWRKTQDKNGMARLENITNAYEEVLPNLQVHADGYPDVDYIRSISVFGQTGYGMATVGDDKDSEGSELIIAAVDKDDPRPVWVNLWGGANTLAQALWKVKNTRSEEEVAEFVSKIRVYDVLGQDDAGAWLVTNFPDLIYIRALQVYGFGGNSTLSGNDWRNKNVISHGPLGALYPLTTYGAFEGDSPSFMYQMPTGMNDPEHPDWGSWGGRFNLQKVAGIRSMSAVTNETDYDPYYMIGDASEKNSAISRWQIEYQNDFAARMDWTISENYSDANHHPIAVLNGDTTRRILEVNGEAGTTFTLSALGSSDPDEDQLSYSWEFYKEPSSYKGTIQFEDTKAMETSFTIPEDAVGHNIHIILKINDDGEPNLYAYRRVVITVN